MSESRLFYIDNLRIFLTGLVVLHHFSITYGAPGGWYYVESQADFPLIILMSMFVATNQAFFMGMFFFISAFFIVPSLQRKGTRKYIADRLVRLGIPTLVFYFLLSPLTVFIRNRFIRQQDESFMMYLKNGWGMSFGPMWFVEALIIFTAIYLLVRLSKRKVRIGFPSAAKILVFALLTGFAQYLIRIKLPVGWSQDFTNFQFPFFLQYIFLFAMGIVAYQNNWMDRINGRMGLRWFVLAQILILIVFPVLIYAGGAEAGIEPFMGGSTWQSLSYSVWEQLVGFSLITGLFGIFKKWRNSRNSFTSQLSGAAYGVYIFHPVVLVAISALFLNFEIPQLLKFIVLAPLALVSCFLVAWLMKKITVLRNIL